MPDYTVKAPDGKMITLSGPAGASQADILAQAQALYKPQAKPPARAARSVVDPKTAGFLQKYTTIRDGMLANVKPAQRDFAMRRFDSDPRAQRLRKLAGLAPLSTTNREVRQTARTSVNQRMREAGAKLGQNATGFQSAAAGIRKGLFGVPDMLAAAGERFLPSAITGNTSDASYRNILEMIRGKTDAEIAANPGVGIVGEVGGAIASGSGAAKLIQAGGRRLAASGARILARAGQLVEGAATLRKGQRVRNTAKLVGTGAAGGGVQAAGTGGNVKEGVAYGAAGTAVLGTGFKAAQVLSRPVRDLLRLSSADQILSRLTTTSRSQIERLAETYRRATGAEPTVFELLPLADRNKILKSAVVGKDNAVEAAAGAIRQRAGNLGPEMSNRARQILTPQRDFIHRGLTNDLTTARGGQLLPDDDALIAGAMENSTDMLRLRDEEARAIMAPHDNTPVVGGLEDLFPQAPGPGGTAVSLDPEVATVIRSAAGTLRARPQNAGVSAGDVTDMISTLRGDLAQGGIEGRNAQRAIDHLQDMLDTNAPDAGAAARQMADTYAARSRMAEGMQEGGAQRLRNEVEVGTNRGQARTVRNAYDTAEGASGRSLGQGNRIITELGGSPEEALRATVRQSRGSTSRQVSQNVGPVESDLLMDAARAQDESAQALAAASNKAQSGSGDGADGEMLVQAIAGLHPGSFITTKAGAVRRLLDMTYIPETRARTIVDMIFSQDPAMQRRALAAIGNEPNGANFVKALALTTGRAASEISSVDGIDAPLDDPEAPLEDLEAPSVEGDLVGLDAPAEGELPAEELPPVDVTGVGGDSPYAPALQQIYSDESPELIDLIQRVKHQESRGNQGAVSSKGALGVMQVMPGTAPEAARMAGIQWDENAYKNDAAYNEIIGIAYLSEQLRKYDGNVARALAAYNAGPDATDRRIAAHGDHWLASMPAETRDYVAKIGA